MANETIDITVFETPDIVNLNITPNLIEINIIQSEGGNNILQFDSLSNFPATGSVDFIYLAKDTNRIYRWNGSAYVEISGSASLVWGAITGTLSNQEDLQNALNAKQDDLNGTGFVKVSGTTVSYDNNTYALDSSVVKLTGDQSIAGNKYFTGVGLFDNTIFIKQDSSVSFLAGYNSIDSDTTGIIFSLPAGNMAKFILTSLSASRDYTLPNSSGTIALTSDIPSLSGYVPTSRTITINDTTFDLSANRTYTIPTNSGTVTSVALTVPSAFSVSGSPITSSGTLAISATGDTSQYIRGDGTLATLPSVSGFVPYTGATTNLDLGTHTIIAAKGTFSSSGSADTVGITHSSGSGIALNISKAGNGEGLYINKSSGSGNAVTVIGTLNATTLVKSGGTSTQFLKADGSIDSNTYLTTDNASTTYLPLTGGILTGTTRMDGSGGTTEPITMVFNTGINRLLTPVLRLYGSTNVASNYVELFGTPATENRTVIFPDASGTVALTSNLHDAVTIGTANGLSLSTQVLSLGLASTSTTGALSSTDWNTFNNKASTASLANYLALTGGTLTGALNGTSATFSSTATATAFIPTGSTVPTNGMYLSAANTLAFATSSAAKMLITSAGYVGIGTSAASHLLTLALPSGVNGEIIRMSRSAGSYAWSLGIDSATSHFNFYNNGSSSVANINLSTGAYTATSDERLKENILDSDNAIEKLLQIKVRKYDWKDTDIKENYGFVAQELFDVLPQYVSKGDEDRNWGVAKAELVPILVKAIQELNEKIIILENR